MRRQGFHPSFINSRGREHAAAITKLREMSLEPGRLVIDLDEFESRQLFESIQTNPAEQVNRDPQPSRMEREGPALWAELHRWALTVDVAGDQACGQSKRWLCEFTKRLSCGDCRRDFDKMILATPPDFSSNAALFTSTVKWHNEVNRKLGKPEMSLADAQRITGHGR